MTPQELKSSRKRLGLTQAGLARALLMSQDNGGRTVRRWEAGTHPIPGPVELAIKWLLHKS